MTTFSDSFVIIILAFKLRSVPSEFRFVTTGSDWPSSNDEEVRMRADFEKERFQINPLRRAANWILRRRRQ